MVDLISSFSDSGEFGFSCEECGKGYSVAPDVLGHAVKCKKCKREILVPNPSCDITCKGVRYYSVTLLKASGLRAFDFFDFEVAYALVKDKPTRLVDVFPLEAIQAEDSKNIIKCRVDDSLVREVREIYPDETNLYARVNGQSLASVEAFLKSERGEEFVVSGTISEGFSLSYGTRKGSEQIYINVDLLNRIGGISSITATSQANPNRSPLVSMAGITLKSAWLKKIIYNMRRNLRNDIEFRVEWRTQRGIEMDDKLLLPGSVVERLLLMVNANRCKKSGGMSSFDSRSEVIFYQLGEEDELPKEDQYDEAGNLKVVYILVNPSMPGIVKIGRTTQGVRKRMEQLNTTGVAQPYECFYAAFVHDDVEVEKALHECFSEFRVNERREFFQVLPQK